MIKKIALVIIILSLLTPIIYADTYSELIDKILCIKKQRTQREPIKIEVKGHLGGNTYIYITSVMKIKEIKPKEK